MLFYVVGTWKLEVTANWIMNSTSHVICWVWSCLQFSWKKPSWFKSKVMSNVWLIQIFVQCVLYTGIIIPNFKLKNHHPFNFKFQTSNGVSDSTEDLSNLQEKNLMPLQALLGFSPLSKAEKIHRFMFI